MTRPQIIRADTIDLQDPNYATASDHTRQPTHPSPLGVGPAAPHQQAALHHVQAERASEESELERAWHNGARADPPSDNEEDMDSDGQQHDGGDDQDMADAESDDNMDDDMMDKISSSPSIDDGGSLSRSAGRPVLGLSRSSRASPVTPPSSCSEQASSSSKSPSPPLQLTPLSSSPSQSIPESTSLGLPHQHSVHTGPADVTFPLFSTRPANLSLPSGPYPILRAEQARAWTGGGHHLGYGEYEEDTDWHEKEQAAASRSDANFHDFRYTSRATLGDLFARAKAWERDVLVSSLGDEATSEFLLPPNDPIPEDPPSSPPEPPIPIHILNEDDGWETDSDSVYYDDCALPHSLLKARLFFIKCHKSKSVHLPCETEDIDFEFVYALHTFVATVEGQANATKGDTMVLLDDSNSYWWLVRIVKDSSIGYLPAEHIETPTERLARLNKHRNIDLSATMLGDTAEKSKNPLKKAMRRRNGRTVQINLQPIYVEASDYDYTSDEEEGDDDSFGAGGAVQEQQGGHQAEQDGITQADPQVNGRRDSDTNGDLIGNGRLDEVDTRRGGESEPRLSDDSMDRPIGPSRSRNGTIRNTDSFFKDDSAETRKITITPGLLRDDTSTLISTPTLRQSSELRDRGNSLDSLDKSSIKSEGSRDDKKRKDKKSGMFSGLFKKKDKKQKGEELEEMQLGETSPKISQENTPLSPTSPNGSFPRDAQQPQRVTSKGKLQKPRGEPSSNVGSAQSTDQNGARKASALRPTSPSESTAVGRLGLGLGGATSTMRMVQADQQDGTPASQQDKPPSLRLKTDQGPRSLGDLAGTLRSPIDDGQPALAVSSVKPVKERQALDDFDSSSDETEEPVDLFSNRAAGTGVGAGLLQSQATKQRQQQQPEPVDRSLSESPVHVSPVRKVDSLDTDDSNQPPGLVDDSSIEDRDAEPSSSPDFEDLGNEIKPQAQQHLQPSTNPFISPNFSQGMPHVAPLSFGRKLSDTPPPPPTRAAPTPTQGYARDTSQTRSVSAAGARSITPTSTASRLQRGDNVSGSSASTFASPPPGLSSSPDSASSSATPTPTTVTPQPPINKPTIHDVSLRTTPPALPAWSDASLRAYMDDAAAAQVRNLLLVVNDTSGLVRLGPEDDEVKSMFKQERETLARVEKEMDDMLTGWIERKRKAAEKKGSATDAATIGGGGLNGVGTGST